MKIIETGYQVTLSRRELCDLTRALGELDAMQCTFPEFRNGFDSNTATRVRKLAAGLLAVADGSVQS